jgi:hypothetical protein
MSDRDVRTDVIIEQLRANRLPPAGFDENDSWHPGPHVCRAADGTVRVTWDGSPSSEIDGMDRCVLVLKNLGYQVLRNLDVDYGRLEIR